MRRMMGAATIAALLMWAQPAVADDAAHRQLDCLAKYYPSTLEMREGALGLRLPSGAFVIWQDGRAKSLDEKLESPDLEDTLSVPYTRGPIAPISDASIDPGRARVEALFVETYPVQKLTTVAFAGKHVKFAPRAAAALQRVGARLSSLRDAHPEIAPYLEALGGTFNERNIAGTDRKSAHSFAIAIDLNPKLSDYWRWSKNGPDGKPRWKNRMPAIIVEEFEKEGFIWGGRWFHFDTMHFEYRPELFDAACSP